VDTLTFLAKLAWPLVGLILGTLALLFFRRPIVERIGRVARAKIPGGTELTFNPQDVASEDPKIVALADAKVAELARELEGRLEPRLAQLEQQQTTTSQALEGVMAEVKDTLSASRRVDEEAREETVSEAICSALMTARRALTFSEIMALVARQRAFRMRPISDAWRAIEDMRSRGIVRLSTSKLSAATEVSLTSRYK